MRPREPRSGVQRLAQPHLEEAPLGLVRRELEGGPVRSGRLRPTSEPAKKVRLRGVGQVIPG